MNPFAAWTPGPGPLYTTLTKTWETLALPDPPKQLVNWIEGESPLSTQKAVVAAIGTYLLVVFGGREMMRDDGGARVKENLPHKRRGDLHGIPRSLRSSGGVPTSKKSKQTLLCQSGMEPLDAPILVYLLRLDLPFPLSLFIAHVVLSSHPPSSILESLPRSLQAAYHSQLPSLLGGLCGSSRSPFKLTFLFQIHNLILTSGSLVLLLLMLEEIVPLYFKHGFYWSICHPAAFTPRLISFYMVNYYIKYVELIDTVFLVLKKKPLQFLHVFHHAATAVLCYTQLEGETSVQWVVITLNLTVHVIMYYYYYATTGGAKIWWKKYLTTLQITQFVIDLFIVYFASTCLFSHRLRHNAYPSLTSLLPPSSHSFPNAEKTAYNHFAYKYSPLPVVDDCTGSEGAALFGCGLLTSYLFLFIAFYRATYKKTGNKAKAASVGTGLNGHAQAAKRGSEKSKVVVENSRGVAVVTERH
ncbi:hypothetical protein EHS25_001027 [Saitozyma podzolica]|uniref:Elongation of fatty acids protein n=1 Tax=Saitozyma podzolica TaxID=1890683 RepID=A0A427YH62_9TREE|nr:hypothetical protein EHS25_001027 [Saitozyma podzolica]